MSIEYRQFPKKMKQEQQPQPQITIPQEMPKMPQIQLTKVQTFNSSHSREYKKQVSSPIRIKQFLKLFKNSDSNTRILKVSPYCNSVLKNKIINALQSTNTKRNQKNEKYYYPLKKMDRMYGSGNEKSEGELVGTVSGFEMNSWSQDISVPRGRKEERKKEKGARVQGFLKSLTIQIQDDSMEIQINEDIVDQNFCLDMKKIIEEVQQSYRGVKYSNKIFSVVGFSVVGFHNKKKQRNSENPRRSFQNQEKSSTTNTKNLLQCSSYLLSIGKLSIRSPRFEKIVSLTLKCLFPKRIKQFMGWKKQKQNSTQRNSQSDTQNISKGHRENADDQNAMKNVTISDFDIIKCLGSGGFSTVFLVRGNFNGKYYAMKVIDKKFIMETERDGIVENQRFILETLSKKQEIQRKGINFITELSFSFETCSHFIFVLEYCPGGQLFNQLKKVRKMSEEQAKFYFLQILVAIDYIHSHKVIYRDLKPENLLIDADGHIKIADFGLSKPLQNFKTPSYSFCGSPEYMAPQMLTKSGHTHLLDYYCLGALLYQLVIGVPPYYSLKQQEIYESILTEELSFPKHVPLSTEIMNLLTGLLKKDPKYRLGSLCGIKEIMCHPWFGRISRATIENKELRPPFVPDLGENNFDDAEIKANVGQILEKLKKDARDRTFQTHFSEEFMFINSKEKLKFLEKYSKFKNSNFFSKTSRRSHLPKSNSVPHTNRFISPYACRSLLRQKQQSKHSTLRNDQRIDEVDEKTKRKMKSQKPQKSKSRRKKIIVKRNIDKQNWQ